MNWENLIILKVNKYISVNFAAMLIYDDNVAYIDPDNGDVRGARTQFMETLTVGFAYSLTK